MGAENSDDMEKYRCLDYMAEYRNCISAFHQFHQYYIHGKFNTCKEPKERIKNCIKWKTFRSEEAKKRMRDSLEREQKDMHTPQPIWTYRSSPPSDW